jgi:hypothetical protein
VFTFPRACGRPRMRPLALPRVVLMLIVSTRGNSGRVSISVCLDLRLLVNKPSLRLS